MLDKEFAAKFIERVTRYTDFNVNIMDERGIIIASRDKKRIGQYHEIAYRLVTGTEEMIDTTGMSFPNVLPGINMVIATGGRREGVVGVTGDPEEVRPVALMVKMAFETMLKYEQQLEQRRIRENRKEHFIYLLTQVEHSDPEELRSCARDLGYPEESVRIPILVCLDREEAGKAADLLRGGDLHTNRDFSFAMDSRHVLVYKTISGMPGHMFSDYKEVVRAYLEPLQALGKRPAREEPGKGTGEKRTGKEPDRGAGFTAFAGSFQDTYPQYYYGYRHCRWLEQNIDPAPGTTVFFYDHLDEYLRSMLPAGELQRAFYVYRRYIPEHRLRSFAETIGALIRTNYNFGRAADLLYIHKNTLVYRYRGLKDMLGVDPMESAGDRAFLELLYTYLQRILQRNGGPGHE